MAITHRLNLRAYPRNVDTSHTTVQYEFTNAKQKRFTQRLNEPGEASFQLPLADWLHARSQHIMPSSVILFCDDEYTGGSLTDSTTVFTMIPSAVSMDVINSDMNPTVTVSGTGALSILKEAVVYPSHGVGQPHFPIQKIRPFNFTSPTYNERGAWAAAGQWGTVKAPTSPWTGTDDGWPETTAQWIWPATPGYADPRVQAPVGRCYFRRSFAFHSDIPVTLYAACDNEATVYINGQQILTTPAFTNSAQDVGKVEFRLTSSEFATHGDWHTIAVVAENGGSSPGPAGFALVLMQGTTSLLISNEEWVCQAYPTSYPGYTVNEILLEQIGEAQDRGALVDVDTSGITWNQDAEGSTLPPINATANVGDDLLTVVSSLTDVYCDLDIVEPAPMHDYGWRPLVWLPGAMGSDLTTALEKGVNVQTLQYQLKNA